MTRLAATLRRVVVVLCSVAGASCLFVRSSTAAPPQYLGPTPYHSAADSPFKRAGFSYFHREDFEDGALNTPGVSASPGVVSAPSANTDSVDGDDGADDGLGRDGRSYFTNFATNSVTFTFDAAALGGLPTHVGLVWTDVGFSSAPNFGAGEVTFEAFDAGNASLGVFGPFLLGDGRNSGETAEDRFFGVVSANGIASIRMTMPSSTDWEVDHLQYGRVAAPQQNIPEPGVRSIPAHAATVVTPPLVLAGSSDAAYGEVVLHARVLDRRGRPLPGLTLRIEADLRGVARGWNGQTASIVQTETRTAVTDASGLATVRLTRSRVAGEPARWFRGTVDVRVKPVVPRDREMTFLVPSPLRATIQVPPPPTEPAPAPLTLVTFDPPDTTADGFPVWLGSDKRADRVVVVLEGFDLYNLYGAAEVMRLIAPAADPLRTEGIDFLVVNFPDAHLAPDALAPLAERAIRAAARLSGRPVAVAGLSMGGIVARWALVEAEERGEPLPVHTLLLLDTPNRGANLNPALQAMTLRHGTRNDKAALASPAARALLAHRPGSVVWSRRGLPGLDRTVPVRWTGDTREHRAFFDRLHGRNDRNGYPKRCRTIAVANSSRTGGAGSDNLLRLWLPWTYNWTAKATEQDRAPGSLLPPYYVARFVVRRPLGLAGAYLRFAPTFVPNESALDAAPDESPPFDAWYARPDGLPPLPHDEVDPGAAAFVVRELLRTAGPAESERR